MAAAAAAGARAAPTSAKLDGPLFENAFRDVRALLTRVEKDTPARVAAVYEGAMSELVKLGRLTPREKDEWGPYLRFHPTYHLAIENLALASEEAADQVHEAQEMDGGLGPISEEESVRYHNQRKETLHTLQVALFFVRLATPLFDNARLAALGKKSLNRGLQAQEVAYLASLERKKELVIQAMGRGRSIEELRTSLDCLKQITEFCSCYSRHREAAEKLAEAEELIERAEARFLN